MTTNATVHTKLFHPPESNQASAMTLSLPDPVPVSLILIPLFFFNMKTAPRAGVLLTVMNL
jgi:hypothetical protein